MQTRGFSWRRLTVPQTPPPARLSLKGPECIFPFHHPVKVFPFALLGSRGAAQPDGGDSKTSVTPVTFSSGPLTYQPTELFIPSSCVLRGMNDDILPLPLLLPPFLTLFPLLPCCQVSSTPSGCDDLRLTELILQASLIDSPLWYQRWKGRSLLERDWAEWYGGLISPAPSFRMIHSGLVAACLHFPMSSGRKSQSICLKSHICGYFLYILLGYVSISSFPVCVVTGVTSQQDELWFQNIINYFKPRLPVMCLQSVPFSLCTHILCHFVLLTPCVSLCAWALCNWLDAAQRRGRRLYTAISSQLNFYLSVTLCLMDISRPQHWISFAGSFNSSAGNAAVVCHGRGVDPSAAQTAR